MTKIDDDYESIIPTAYVTAYPRIFANIPYSKSIFDALEEIRRKNNDVPLGENDKIIRLAPELEARYKLIDKLLEDSNVQQVLEIASGLSPRGLILAQKYPSVKYAELELKEMAELKQSIIRAISKIPDNLQIFSGSASRIEDFNRVVEGFVLGKRIAVINEGLLRYLNFDQKAVVARNIHSILSRFGGVWITCDTTPKKFLATQDKVTKPGMNKNLEAMSGKTFENNMFEDNEHAIKFFEDLGFSVEVHPFSDILNDLTSPKKLGYSEKVTRQLLGEGIVVVMRPR